MAYSVTLPELGESVTEGTVTRWLKQVGDTVEVDEPLLEVSTDKVDTGIPSPAAGVVTEILAQEDDVVDVGGELARLGDAGEQPQAGSGTAQPQAAQEPAHPQAAQEPAQEPAQPQAAQDTGGGAAADAAGSGDPVNMPELGESVTEGTVTRWLKSVGDEVAVDEPLLEVSTDKVDTEIPSPIAGTLLEVTAQEDEVVEVGGQLAVVGSGAPAPRQAAAPAAPQEAPAQPAPQQAAPAPAPEPEP